MREVIDRLAEGQFDTAIDKLAFSVSKIERSITKDQLCEGTFDLYSLNGTDFHAYIYTSDFRLICRESEVKANTATINYVFDTTGLEAGDIVKGDIQIVSDLGEYYLPFVFAVSFGVVESSMGSVRNIFHFANQAQVSWDEAVELFYSPSFAQVFDGNDRVHRSKFRGFSNRNGDAQAVDDFLVSVNKKRANEITVDRTNFEFQEVTDMLRCDVQLHKSTWGNISMDVYTDAPFITVEKDRLTKADFVGNTHNLVFFIMDEKMHEGWNYGRIVVKSAESEVAIQITARQRARVNAARIERREKRNLVAKLIRLYIDFRLKKCSVGSWVRESMRVVERMNALDDKNPISRLYQAQLLLSQRKDNDARWILEHVAKEMDIANSTPEGYAYYLYLTTLLHRDEDRTDEVMHKVREMYKANPKSVEILWTLLYLDENLSTASAERINVIENMFRQGITSPILYIEAYNYYAANPARLTKLSAFENQVLYFAAKNGTIDDDLLSQITYLASKTRDFSPLLYKLLEMCYKSEEDIYLIEAICTILIKGAKTDVKYFKWFEQGVKNQLRITKLYEYYMYTIPMDYRGSIPKSVYMYFSYRNDMDWHHMALLYASIIRNRKSDPDAFEMYQENMLIFAIEQIGNEHIDSNLALIIETVLETEHIRPSMAPHLAKILFSHAVKCGDSCEKVILVHDQFKKEMIFPVENGEAYPTIYSTGYVLFYEDKNGRRTIVPEENDRKLFSETIYIQAIRNFVSNNVYFSLYLCEGKKHYVSVDDNNAEFCRQLADSDELEEFYKRDIRMSLLRFYYDNDQITTMDDFLIHMNIKVLSEKDRAEAVQYYVYRGMFEQAYQIVSIYGLEEVSASVCVRICNHMINQKDFVPDTMLIKLCYNAFKKGKYDETTLKYLVGNFDGLTKELRNIWKAAREFDVECYSLMEKLIIQMLFTRTTVGEREEIFEEYIKRGASTRVELAYLSNSAYEYFVRERLTDERIFSHIVHNYRMGEEINDACRLAILKYYAEEETKYSTKIKEMLVAFIMDFLHRNIFFKFFLTYQDVVPELLEYIDKTVIEYRTSPESRVTLHYILENSSGNDDEYRTEEMRNVFGGVFSREFILFFGENLQYYITEERAGREMLTQSDSISVSDTGIAQTDSRYSLLNDMVVSKAVGDDATLMKLMQEYVEADSFGRKVFTLR